MNSTDIKSNSGNLKPADIALRAFKMSWANCCEKFKENFFPNECTLQAFLYKELVQNLMPFEGFNVFLEVTVPGSSIISDIVVAHGSSHNNKTIVLICELKYKPRYDRIENELIGDMDSLLHATRTKKESRVTTLERFKLEQPPLNLQLVNSKRFLVLAFFGKERPSWINHLDDTPFNRKVKDLSGAARPRVGCFFHTENGEESMSGYVGGRDFMKSLNK